MQLQQSQAITVCIPAYNCSEFIQETLQSVVRQDHTDLHILISLDSSTDNSEDIIREYMRGDPRIELVIQKDRLGWVKNINFLLEAVQTPVFSILPHDDIIAPDYYSRLIIRLDECPEAIGAFSFMTRFGLTDVTTRMPELRGDRLRRLTEFLAGPRNTSALPFRGLTRSGAVKDGQRLISNEFNGYAADVLWVMQLLFAGDLVHVPEVMYRKRSMKSSVVGNFRGWPVVKILAAEELHSRTMHSLLHACGLPEQHRLSLQRIAAERYEKAVSTILSRK